MVMVLFVGEDAGTNLSTIGSPDKNRSLGDPDVAVRG